MPLASSTWKSVGAVSACVCMSLKPGTTYLPAPSISTAVPLTLTSCDETCVIFPSSMMTATLRASEPSRVLTTVTFWTTVPLVTNTTSPLLPPPLQATMTAPTAAAIALPMINLFLLILVSPLLAFFGVILERAGRVENESVVRPDGSIGRMYVIEVIGRRSQNCQADHFSVSEKWGQARIIRESFL